MEVQSERTARPFPLRRLHSGPQSWSVDQCPETPPEHLESSVADAMRRSVVTHHSRRIKDLSFNDRSNLAGQVAGYRTLFLKYRGATILGRLRTSRFLNESVYARASEIAKKGPASCGASSIRENRTAVLPAPRQNGGHTEESLRRP